MGLIERYIFRRALVAFLATLTVLTGVVWVTQALRQLDLVTAKGQAIGAFLAITGLALPFLVLLIAPFAVVIAAIVTLATLNADSELVVMQASGASRWRTLKPILAIGVAVGLLAAVLTFWAAPAGLKQVREALTQVRIDLVASIIRPGRFIEIDDGLTFHIRDRAADGGISGIVLDDERDPDRSMTYLANGGHIVEALDRTLLVMSNGTIQRRIRKDGSLSIVRFDAYAFDLSNTDAGGERAGLSAERAHGVRAVVARRRGCLRPAEPRALPRRAARPAVAAALSRRLRAAGVPVPRRAADVAAGPVDGDPRRDHRGHRRAPGGLRRRHARRPLPGGRPIGVYVVPLLAIAGSLAILLSDRRVALPGPLARLVDAAGDAVDAVARRLPRLAKGA